jgi:hypothetical protein
VWAYFDSSALAKRYVREAGRRELLRLLRRYDVVTSAVSAIELRSALRRRAAEGTLDANRVPAILKHIASDREFWAVMEVSKDVLSSAEALVAAHPIRTLDAIHVGSAQLFSQRIPLPRLMFVSADSRQAAAAAAIGLTITHIES